MSDEPRAPDPRLLARAARFCERQPECLGYWLERYRETEGLERGALARHLGGSPETLDQLSLCSYPSREGRAAALARFEERFGVDAARLGAVLLQAELFVRTQAQEAVPARPAPHLAPVFAAAREVEAETSPAGQPAVPEGESDGA